jgi:transforming growth factor-beta-induced protein
MRTIRPSARAVVASALIAVFGVASIGTASADDMTPSTTTSSSTKPTIVGAASADPQFSTLVSAVTAAGLVDTLNGKGPFTVFAPTNDAFAKIPEDQLQAILADKDKLTKILTYHVLPAKVLSKNLKKKQTVETVEGSPVTIVAKKSGVKVGDAKVVKADVKTSNGVIHVIDTVILPPGI